MRKIISGSGGGAPALLTAAEVARMFRVDPKTVARWTASGWIPREAYVFTLGGHRRYHRTAMEALLSGQNGRRP